MPASCPQLTPTALNWPKPSVAPGYIIVWRPPASCGRTHLHRIQPRPQVKVIFRYLQPDTPVSAVPLLIYTGASLDWSSVEGQYVTICPLAFSRCFISNFGVHTESQIELFIWTTGVDCSSSVNHDNVQVLSYSILHYSYLLLGLNLQPQDDFTQKHLQTKCQVPLSLAILVTI